MSNFEVGQILEDSYNIGSHVLATLIIDPDHYDGSQYPVSGVACPACGEDTSRYPPTYCIHHDMQCYCFYCPECWILFEKIEIGYLDEENNFHEW